MKKDVKNRSEKLYLKILGTFSLIAGVIGIVCGALIAFAKIATVDQLELGSARTDGVTDDQILAIAGWVYIIIGLVSLIEGWLLFRAANHPEKSTFLLVLIVISVISGIVGLFGNKSASTLITAIINLSINVLALMAIMRIRREIDE